MGELVKQAKDLDFAQLLGFETMGDHIQDGFDFQHEAFGAKLGAKVGAPEPDGPECAPQINARDSDR